jgi:hypothetical protein
MENFNKYLKSSINNEKASFFENITQKKKEIENSYISQRITFNYNLKKVEVWLIKLKCMILNNKNPSLVSLISIYIYYVIINKSFNLKGNFTISISDLKALYEKMNFSNRRKHFESFIKSFISKF